MSTYVFVYRAPGGPQAGGEAMQAWQSWFGGLDGHVAEIGQPAFSSATVGTGPSDTVVCGYSLISADSLDEASRLAQGCPVLSRGGAVEIGELTAIEGM